MKQILCASVVLACVACGTAQEVSMDPDFTVNGAKVFLDQNVTVDANQIMNDIAGFNDVTSAALPSYKAIDFNNIEIHISAHTFTSAECGYSNGCYGYTKIHSDGKFIVYVAIVDSACFSNNALGHELSHVLLNLNTGDSDVNHKEDLFWGYWGIVNTVKIDVGVTCETGADLTET